MRAIRRLDLRSVTLFVCLAAFTASSTSARFDSADETLVSCPGQPDGTACDDGNPCTLGEACRAGSCAPPVTVAQASGSPVAAGSNPISVAVSDFSGDGKLDLAVANQSSHNVTVLLGDGVGGFAATAGSPVAAGTNPVSIAVGDITGDGKLDLVVANSSSNDATILLGNGAGAFAPAATSPLTVGASPRSVVTRDWNGDGKLDLAVANRFSDFVTILLGDGAAGFTPAAGSPVPVGTSPYSLAAGDVNADGKLDLAVANNGSNTVTVLLGDGFGGFSAAVGSPVAVGANPESVAIGDVNGDGKLDLATANAGSNNVSVLLGNGSGVFSPAAGSPLTVGVNPEFVGIADLNGDGKADLVVTNGSSNNVTLWLGNGSGGFGQAAGSPVAVGSNPVPVAVGDWTGDGSLDLAVVNFSSSSLTILLNNTPAAPNGTACNDGNGCTQTDTCQSRACTGSNPVVCTAIDPCHLVGICDPGSGQCSQPNAPNGNACADGNACTQTDTCQTGVCTGSNPVVCAPLDQCHDAGICNNGTGICTNPNKANGASCNDGNGCTQTDTCQSGTCTGSNPVVCTASDQCHVEGACAPPTGVCSNPAKADGTACNDGNGCTQTDTCQSGNCTGGNPFPNGTVCNDGNDCTQTDSCQSGLCSGSNPTPNGAVCNDGNACTQNDACQTGVCTGSNPVICTASDQCHVVGICNPGTGVCTNPNKANGTTCNDGNACTQPDSCQTGSCIGSPVVCTPFDQCHVAGTCNSVNGTCSNPNKANGSVCNDSNSCTQTDTCQSGNCTGSNSLPNGSVCNDGNACTQTDICQSGHCAGSNPLPNGSVCNDGNACTQTDACQTGLCMGSNSVVCTASDPCHIVGSCNPGTGVCGNPNAANGTACNDGNGCTQTDTCLSGSCTGSNPLVCTASDPCHAAGTCIPPTGSCSNPNAANGTACNDGNPCTATDACNDGACSGTALPALAEVDNGLRIARSGGAAVISWNPAAGATSSAVLRGLVSGLAVGPGGGDESCLASGVPTSTSTITDATGPVPGAGFWYLVRGDSLCAEGPYGFQTQHENPTVPRASTTCGIACSAGSRDCDNDPANGCEVDLRNDAGHCGTCANVCPARANAGTSCSAGVCGFSCNSGFADCNTNPTDGCEVSTTNDTSNCSGCGVACPTRPNSAPSCVNSACGIACNAGFVDCNLNTTDGCESALDTDPNNCGSCGASCSSNHIPVRSCTGGQCNGACAAGFADCNGNKRTDGCEVNTNTDSNNCSTCGVICPGSQTCSAGSCVVLCPTGTTNCNGSCRDLNNDSSNCGTCGRVCPGSLPNCIAGTCN